MSHRVIILESYKTLLQNPEVREHLTVNQLARVDHICTHSDVSDDDFRYLSRKIDKIYCEED